MAPFFCEEDAMSNNGISKYTQDIIKLHGKHGYSCDQYFSWMVDDVLAGFGVKPEILPPEEIMPVLFDISGEYAQLVIKNEPFFDVLGSIYMELASHGQKKSLGQYFTPWHLSKMMATMTFRENDLKNHSGLFRAFDPACGSGVMMLSFANHVLENCGADALKNISLSGIDLDRLCSRMAPCQILSNCFIERVELGEILFYQGNGLGPIDDLNVVVHASSKSLDNQECLPAKDIRRESMIQESVRLNMPDEQIGLAL